MRFIRVLGNVLLWVVAIIGVLSGALWTANQLGKALPVVVVSGSMQPEFRTGDLLIATRTDAGELDVGDVATLPSLHADTLVTHRIVSIERRGDDYVIRMKGDANTALDAGEYVVPAGSSVWTPSLTIPKAGAIGTTVAKPGVAIPLLISLGALIAMSSIPPAPKPQRRKDGEPEAAPTPDGAHGELDEVDEVAV